MLAWVEFDWCIGNIIPDCCLINNRGLWQLSLMNYAFIIFCYTKVNGWFHEGYFILTLLEGDTPGCVSLLDTVILIKKILNWKRPLTIHHFLSSFVVSRQRLRQLIHSLSMLTRNFHGESNNKGNSCWQDLCCFDAEVTRRARRSIVNTGDNHCCELRLGLQPQICNTQRADILKTQWHQAGCIDEELTYRPTRYKANYSSKFGIAKVSKVNDL